MRVVLTGATGTIGRSLTRRLLERGDRVVAISRSQAGAGKRLGDDVEIHEWVDPIATRAPTAALAGADAVIHLLGEPVAQRWTPSTREAIRDSRVLGTANLVAGLRALPAADRPAVLVSQSATGYYGPRGDEPIDESAPPGTDFLAAVVVAWEREALRAADIMRVAVTRTGVVLSPDGGALAKMLPFFRLGLGGPVAGGHQYVPWIHLDDVVSALLFCADNEQASGALNLTAPNSVTNIEFARALGRALHRPAVLPVPGLALQMLYGGMSQLVTTGQRVQPAALQRIAFGFRHPEIGPALNDVLSGT
jgi:uncharacterized protein (TIGR01777 family)